ncbi:MAG: hypothetical protein HY094_07550 [Candidatus Melainabacteria bacterium]|nr:hypothetical protein [Candidatus Melainabacteria bacterium]
MYITKLKTANIHEVDVNELPDKKLIGRLLLEETIKFPGDILIMDNKSYITVEKVHHYYFDGAKYQFAKTSLHVKALKNFC